MEKQGGVTLISLVITIIILLILAGITINFALGENGILRHAKIAVEKYENSTNDESYTLSQISNEIGALGGSKTLQDEVEEYKKLIVEILNKSGIQATEGDSKEALLKKMEEINLNSMERRTSTSIPQGVTKVIIIHCSGTTYNHADLQVSGDIVKEVKKSRIYDNVVRSTYAMAVYECIVTTNGEAGNLNITYSGGSGNMLNYYCLYY